MWPRCGNDEPSTVRCARQPWSRLRTRGARVCAAAPATSSCTRTPPPPRPGWCSTRQRRVLLGRRSIEPYRGQWALPAGYQEIDEPPAQTAVREVLEESGIQVRVLSLFDLIFVPEDLRRPANVAIYLCAPVGGVLCAGEDALEAAWFGLDALPPDLGFDNGPRILERLPSGAHAGSFLPRRPRVTLRGRYPHEPTLALRRSRRRHPTQVRGCRGAPPRPSARRSRPACWGRGPVRRPVRTRARVGCGGQVLVASSRQCGGPSSRSPSARASTTPSAAAW